MEKLAFYLKKKSINALCFAASTGKAGDDEVWTEKVIGSQQRDKVKKHKHKHKSKKKKVRTPNYTFNGYFK